ncbi:MAG: tetratricopeptide repeat protein [Deltaproteobacteria bacterium]|nr:tetratricopeptide repeat protein [Deltaproteobacteria bacterium]
MAVKKDKRKFSLDTRFIVAESNPSILKNVLLVLKYVGFTRFTKATDGDEAWDIIKNKPISFVVSNWDLEKTSGVDLLRKIRSNERLSRTPVLLMSSRLTKDHVIEAGRFGVNGLIVLPLTIKVLEQQLELISDMLNDPEVRQADKFLASAEKFFKEDNYEQALESYAEAMKVYHPAEVYYNVGYIKAAQDKYGEALVAFRKATEINSSFAKAFRGMGTAYQKLGMADKAQEAMQKAAEIYIGQNREEDAEDLLLEVAKSNPDTSNVYNLLGILYRKQKKYAQSIEQYRNALKATPDDENIHFNMGLVFIELKEYQNAIVSFESALALNPSFPQARQLINSTQKKLQENDRG